MTTTINGNVAAYLFRIYGSYVRIDGNNSVTDRALTISNSSAQSVVIGIFSFGSDKPTTNVEVENTTLINGSTTYHAVVLSEGITIGESGYLKQIKIRNNAIRKAYYGIYAHIVSGIGYGEGVEFSNNDLSASGADAIRNVGIYLKGGESVVISGNTIGNLDGRTNETDIGIWLDAGVKNIVVERNSISNLFYDVGSFRGANGIYISSGRINASILVANNFISNISAPGSIQTDNPIAIALGGPSSQSGINIYHNTIHLTGNKVYQVGSFSAGIYLYSGNSASVVNNIIVNNLGLDPGASATGSYAVYGAIGVYAESRSQFTDLRNNNYYIAPSGAGAKVIGRIGNAAYATLADWQAASGETNATNIQPVFTSTTDLHLVPASNTALDNTWTPLSVTTDFDKEGRSQTTPDVGADEFTGPCIAPSISTQPSAQAVCPGSSASFRVAASGTGLAYQWKKDGVAITGAQAGSYVISSVGAGDAANYEVVVTGSCGTVTTNPVALTVHPVPVPDFTIGTAGRCENGVLTLTNTSTVATGAIASYQWEMGNGTTSTEANPTVSYTAAGNYTIKLTATSDNNCQAAVSRTVQINGPTVITTQPVARTICPGESVTFSVAATGSQLTYQWKKGGAAIAEATGSSYTITGATAAHGGAYEVVVTGDCGAVTSAPVALSFKAATAITTQPVAQTVCAGAPVSFSVEASGSGTLTYQWRKDGVAINGATAATYAIAAPGSADGGEYSIVVSGACGAQTSSAAVLTVKAMPAVPTITTAGATAFCTGGNVQLTSSAAGGNQWYNNGVAITNATGNTYTASAEGVYSVIASVNGCSSAASTGVTVTVRPRATTPTISISSSAGPAATTFCEGGLVPLNSSGPNSQWYRDGVAISGATNPSLEVRQSGVYTVTAANEWGCVSLPSEGVAVTVTPLPAKPTIMAAGAALSSSVASGNQWLLNGEPITGATGQQFQAQVAGQYTVRVTQNGCTNTSDVFNFVTTGIVNPARWGGAVFGYPNPVPSTLFIANREGRKLKVQLLDMKGQRVYEGLLTATQGTIDMKPMASGSYLLLITDVKKGETIRQTLVKQ